MSRIYVTEDQLDALADRIVDTDIQSLESIANRVGVLELWRSNKAASISNVLTNLPENNNLLMGLGTLIGVVNQTNQRVNANAVIQNTMLTAMRSKEMIAA